MNVIIWARVSSREQREGYSLDAQLRAANERAQKSGWKVVREFVVAESAKRGAERHLFNEMFQWVRTNAKRENIKAILSHKLDRVCRNMRDAVRLQELEDTCGVQLAFVDNQFGTGAAGALSFNVMAAVAQYYSDNLRSEVIKGMDEKVKQGWPTGGAPYGYQNTKDRNCPIIPHPIKSKAVIRIFELYSRGTTTFNELADQLAHEGHIYQPSQPRFIRSAFSYILNNRFYVGEIVRNNQIHPGKFQPLITHELFNACQDVLHGKNRKGRTADTPLAGGVLRCAYCNFAITGERIRRKLNNGKVNEHIYYRCGNNHKPADHPKLRWRHEDVEAAIVKDLQSLQIQDPNLRNLIRTALAESCADIVGHRTRYQAALTQRQSELQSKLDRLLETYLNNNIDEATFAAKSEELKREIASVAAALSEVNKNENEQNEEGGGVIVRDMSGDKKTGGEGHGRDMYGDKKLSSAGSKLGKGGHGRDKYGDTQKAITIFDYAQNLAEVWQRSTWPVKREILNSVSLNRQLSDVSLCISKRKPFDFFAKGLLWRSSRGDRI